jgi:hypothetical protein
MFGNQVSILRPPGAICRYVSRRKACCSLAPTTVHHPASPAYQPEPFCAAQHSWPVCSDSSPHALPHTAGKLQHSSAARPGRRCGLSLIAVSHWLRWLIDSLGAQKQSKADHIFIMISFPTPVCVSHPTLSHVPVRQSYESGSILQLSRTHMEI